MRKYFLYEFKKRGFAIGVIALVMSAVYVLPIISTSFFSRGTGVFVWLISTEGGIIAAIVPMWMFSYRTKKRSVDLYYSLPISHLKILTVKFLIGLIAVFLPYTIAYWLGAFADTVIITLVAPTAVYYIPQFFASLIPIYLIYAISAFVFTRANRVIDGILFIVFWAFAVALVISVLEELTTRNYLIRVEEYNYYYQNVGIDRYFHSYYFLPFTPLDFLTTHFQRLIAGGTMEYNFEIAELVNLILGFSLTTLMAAGSTVGLFLMERKTKAENAGQISDSWFGYKTMLPIYTACLTGICGSIILIVMISIGAYLLTAAYRRSFKIGKIQAIVLPVSFVVGLIIYAILYYRTGYVYLDSPV